jgi:hypothetical protein
LNRKDLTAKDAKDAKGNEDKNFGTADERRLTRMKTGIEFFPHLRSLASIGGSNLLYVFPWRPWRFKFELLIALSSELRPIATAVGVVGRAGACDD